MGRFRRAHGGRLFETHANFKAISTHSAYSGPVNGNLPEPRQTWRSDWRANERQALRDLSFPATT
jgi:hypothetical protein